MRDHPVVVKYIQECVDKVNKKATSRVHTIKKWRILPCDFSAATGEFTPTTMKLKRAFTVKKYSVEIEEMYHDTAKL